jgi:NAD(P)-dependent dehydrogenase (short-subunit alcohol dehydrogenase family)|tara:strand:- start:101 stop:598 length:498 start_codon:yes stop_codon:yes gene_type:complete
VLGRTREEQGQPYRVGDLDLDQYRKVMAVNTDSVIFGTVAVAPSMNSGGGIIITASAAGLVPWKPTPFYSATKHAVVGWVRAVADSLAEQNLSINAICPGGVATALLGLSADAAKTVPRLLDPTTVAQAAIQTALGGATGTAVSVVANREPVTQTHSFTTIPGFP